MSQGCGSVLVSSGLVLPRQLLPLLVGLREVSLRIWGSFSPVSQPGNNLQGQGGPENSLLHLLETEVGQMPMSSSESAAHQKLQECREVEDAPGTLSEPPPESTHPITCANGL